jgi:hypothetical protein
MRRLEKVKIAWSPDFAYAVGLLATDGSLSIDGRHLNLTSKDRELIDTFKECLGLKNKVGRKGREKSKIKRYFQVQFGDRNFYEFLLSLGLTPTKSKTIGPLNIPKEYFADFLRGCIDGDGNIIIVKHPESQHSQLRVRLSSASPLFLYWVRTKLLRHLRLRGGWIERNRSVLILIYAKADSIKLLNFIYYKGAKRYLTRKYKVAQPFLRV